MKKVSTDFWIYINANLRCIIAKFIFTGKCFDFRKSNCSFMSKNSQVWKIKYIPTKSDNIESKSDNFPSQNFVIVHIKF